MFSGGVEGYCYESDEELVGYVSAESLAGSAVAGAPSLEDGVEVEFFSGYVAVSFEDGAVYGSFAGS